MDSTTSHHRPRNVDWKRAPGLLYGDWGTSKAYVLGLAFAATCYSSLPIILAVSVLTAIVGYNNIIVCRHFPDGGGVYSSVRRQSRVLAVMGALLLVANFTVTAAMSGWAAMHCLLIPTPWIPWATVILLFGVCLINYFGPKHTGSLAVLMALPMVAVVILIILLSLPHLTTANLTPVTGPFLDQSNSWPSSKATSSPRSPATSRKTSSSSCTAEPAILRWKTPQASSSASGGQPRKLS